MDGSAYPFIIIRHKKFLRQGQGHIPIKKIRLVTRSSFFITRSINELAIGRAL